MEKETKTDCSGYWQQVARATERVITRGQLETHKQGRARGTTGWAHSEKHEQGRVYMCVCVGVTACILC